jgi:ligand-binding sensor domain-containing protein
MKTQNFMSTFVNSLSLILLLQLWIPVVLAQDTSVGNTSWKIFNSRKHVNAITQSKDGQTLWVATLGGLEQREANTGRLIRTFTNIDGLLGFINTVYVDDNNTLWIGGTATGLVRLSSSDSKWEFFSPFTDRFIPSHNVTAIQPDGEGGVWIAMIGFPKTGGIAHFTASEQWEIFTTENSDLPWNDIQILKRDKNGELWAAGYNGDVEMFRFDDDDNDNSIRVPSPGPGLLHRNRSGVWEVFNPENSALPSVYIQDIHLDDKGGVWVSTGDQGLAYRALDGQWTLFNAENSGLPNNHLRELISDDDGGLWIGLADGRLVHRTQEDNWETFSDTSNPNPTADMANMRGFFIDDQQRFWFGNEGLTQRTLDNQWQHFDTSSLPSTYIRALQVEKNEDWVGTKDKGLVRQIPTGAWEIFNKNNSELPSNQINALLSDEQGGLWIGTENGLAHRTEQGGWEIFTIDNVGLPNNRINVLYPDGDGGLWVGIGTSVIEQGNGYTFQFGGLAHRDKAGQWTISSKTHPILPSFNVTALHTDGEGGLWIGHTTVYYSKDNNTQLMPVQPSGGLTHKKADGTWEAFNQKNSGLPSNDIKAIYLDDNAELWVGTGYRHFDDGKGLAHRLSDGEWEVFHAENSFLHNTILTMKSDNRGGFWVGNLGRGIAHRTVDGNWEYFFTGNSGIPGNEVYALSMDNNQNLWIGTNFGLAHLTFGQQLSGKRAAILIYPESRQGNIKHISSEKIVGYAYQVLSDRYYRNEEIYFLAYKPDIDVNGDHQADTNAVDAPVTYFDKADGITTRSITSVDIRQAFDWAREKGTLNQPLLVTIIADGLSEGKLLLNPKTNEFLDSPELATLLDDYQQATQNEVVVILETSYGGAMMAQLAPINRTKTRLIISSTDADQKTQHTDVLGEDAFSKRYFKELRKGNNFWDAFHQVSSGLPQMPQIDDDNQNGRLARKMCLNGCFTPRPEKTVYHDGDILRITLLKDLPRNKNSYIGIAFPDGSTILIFSKPNVAKPFDGITLSPWQGEDIVIEMPVTANLPRGEYPLYLLRVKKGIEPLTHPEFWELNVGAVTIE